MKKFTTFFLTLICAFSFGQVQQWFPTKLDPRTNKLIPDTSGEQLVSFIKVKNGIANMYGHHTHYPTKMKYINDHYFSGHLTIGYQKDTLKKSFVKAKYFLYLGQKTSKLIIKRQKFSDTLIFIKSIRPFKDINIPWG